MAKMGRPFGTLKYDNLADLQAGIDAYFADCDGNGKPYTITGLALALNIDVKTLANYGSKGYAIHTTNNDDESDGDTYFHAINRARQRCIGYAEDRLYDKDGVQGAKFYLTNNAERMGGLRYSDRQEVAIDVAPISFVDDLGDS